MSLNDLPSGERVHIGFFGMRNAGKSSVVNAITGLNLSVVSDVKGTTTDPVKRAMEILPLGPVVIVDTPGFDDDGYLGEKRVEKTNLILNSIQIAVLVVDSTVGLSKKDLEYINLFENKNLRYVVVYNKTDLKKAESQNQQSKFVSVSVCALNKEGIHELKEILGNFAKKLTNNKFIVRDLVDSGSNVILVIPIDESAPKGRIILPQQMVLRDLLDKHCSVSICQVEELKQTLEMLKVQPSMVITDSQAFKEVSKIVPPEIKLTSFSILMARYKGNLESLLKGAETLSALKDGDKVLISEGCVHHRQCNDIGTKKFPDWIKEYTGAIPEFSFSSGNDFPEQLNDFKLVIHCGACMLNETEMKNRINKAEKAEVPMINYGMAIAKMHGILDRALEVVK